MTPLERAARALADMDTERDIGWRYYIPATRAVLLAVREPSEEMMQASSDNAPDREYTTEDLVIHWQAMIDAALGEVG